MPLGGLGMGEILVILVIVLLLFGAKRLPEIGGALGKGIREFKSSMADIQTELKRPADEAPREVRSSRSAGSLSGGADHAPARQEAPEETRQA